MFNVQCEEGLAAITHLPKLAAIAHCPNIPLPFSTYNNDTKLKMEVSQSCFHYHSPSKLLPLPFSIYNGNKKFKEVVPTPFNLIFSLQQQHVNQLNSNVAKVKFFFLPNFYFLLFILWRWKTSSPMYAPLLSGRKSEYEKHGNSIISGGKYELEKHGNWHLSSFR